MRRLTTKEFIERVKVVHEEKYDYSNTIYVNDLNKIVVNCSEHGLFSIRPTAHMRGQGCKLCGRRKINKTRELTIDSFLKKANEKYNNKYIYNFDKFENGNSLVTITCPKHGDFITSVNRHLARRDCKICKKENQFVKGFGRTSYAKAVMGRKSYVYLIEFKNEAEQFYKIGIAVDIKDRFRRHKVDYTTSLIAVKEYDSGIDTYNKELELHKKCKTFRYTPFKKFNGFSECYIFSKEVFDIFTQQ